MAKTRTEIGVEAQRLGLSSRGAPDKAVRAYFAKTQSLLLKELRSRSRLENKAALAGGKKPRPTLTQKERQQIRQQAQKLNTLFAKHALPLRPSNFEIPGIFSVSAKLAPTFAFARTETDLSTVGNTSTATRSTGAMGFRFFNQAPNGVLRFSLVEMGGFFFPPPGAVRISARATPRVAFSWFMTSDGRRAFTDALVSLRIVGFKGATTHGGEARAATQLWFENRDEGTNGLFDFEVRPAMDFPLATQLKTNNSDFYMITVRCFATHGASDPGTENREARLFGSISASLAAIDLDVAIIPSLEQA